jgi:K+-transporting ATPase A subunit
MTINGWVQIVLYCVIVLALVKPLGFYMTGVFNGERTFLSPVLRPIERALYSVSGIKRSRAELAELSHRHVVLPLRWVSYPLCFDARSRRSAV